MAVDKSAWIKTPMRYGVCFILKKKKKKKKKKKLHFSLTTLKGHLRN